MNINTIKKSTAKGTVLMLLAAEIIGSLSPMTVYGHNRYSINGNSNVSNKENTEMVTRAEELLSEMTGPYDILFKFSDPENTDLSRKERASISQEDAKKIIEKRIKKDKNSVIEWESFFITNAIHLVTNDKELILKISALPQVIRITENGHVDNLEPIEDDPQDKMLRSQKNTLFVPDERDIEWGVSMIHADKVWDTFDIDGTGTVVGIIDGGANYNLPALKKKFYDYDASSGEINTDKEDDPVTETEWEGPAYRDFVDGTDTPQKTSSDDHGTHVAGTIVGEEGKNKNRIGVAPGARFITARAMGTDGGAISDLIAAAEWMYQMHPDVVNNSWGGEADTDEWFKDITDAWEEAGIIPVFAAGNTAGTVPGEGTISNPANYPNVIAVAAVDRNKKIGSFSNKGPSAFDSSLTKPEIAAPGVQVRSVDSKGTYVSWNGTSMAAPHVTGAIALIRAAAKKYGKEDEYDELDEIRNLLMETAEPLTDAQFPESPNYAYGAGLINVYDAVAKIAGEDQARIIGTVLKDGEDKEAPKLNIDVTDEAYIGRDFIVNADISDDISIRSATLKYWLSDESNAVEHLMTVKSGSQKDGTYTYIIPSEELSAGTLHIRIDVEDYANNKVSDHKDITIQKGVSFPWSEDFEKADNGLKGFIIDGVWSLSHREAAEEPAFPKTNDGSINTTYIGTNGGTSYFERRVDSDIYLPPIDLTEVEMDKDDPKTIPTLSLDMYNGFTGITQAKVQASFTGRDDDWEDIYNVVLRPDITSRDWEHVTIPLDKYVDSKDTPEQDKINKDGRPLQVRFYFFGHRADDGVGWYLDNLEISMGEDVAPGQVQDLKGTIENKGLKLHFVANEESDMDHYVIERQVKSENTNSFSELTRIDQDLDNFQFINKGEDKNRPSSHYRVNYYDDSAKTGNTYVYRVYAVDKSGNKGQYSKEITVNYNKYENSVSYDFEDGDSGFVHGKLSDNAVDDWDCGKVNFMSEDEIQSKGRLYEMAWHGLARNKTCVFGTNLDAKPSKGLDSYLLMPTLEIKDKDVLYFDSYSGMGLSGNGIDFYVEIKPEDAEGWTELVSSEKIMDQDQLFTWHQIKKSLRDYAGQKVSIRFHAETSDTVWIDNYNLGWYIDNIYVGKENIEFEKCALDRYGKEKIASQSEIKKSTNIDDRTSETDDLSNEDKDFDTYDIATYSVINVADLSSNVISKNTSDDVDDEDIDDPDEDYEDIDNTDENDKSYRLTDTVSGSFEDLFYDLIDTDCDGELSEEELLEARQSFENSPSKNMHSSDERTYESTTDIEDDDEKIINQFSTKELNELGAGLYSEGHIPVTATITIKETGAYTKSSDIDGSFALNLTAGPGGESKKYTLVITAYGFEPIEKTITVKAGDNVLKDAFVLDEAKKASFSGNVVDDNDSPIEGVHIRIDDDDNYELLTTNADGTYHMSDAFTGIHTLRFFKDGYISLEKEIDLSEGDNKINPVKLIPLGSMQNITTDYGVDPVVNVDNYYNTIFFTSGVKGMAVKFQAPYKGSMLKSADIFTVNNQYFNGNHIEIAVLSYNSTGRLIELAPFREYANLMPNTWNTIDFSEYNIKTDKPLYIAATYEDDIDITDCMGILYDDKATEKAIKHSYVYDGAFTETSTVSPVGAYGVKTTWLYEDGAEKNPESDGFPDDEPIEIPEDELYEFDTKTQTITKYNGKSKSVNVPSKINGITVLRIGDNAFDSTEKEDDEKIRSLTLPDTLIEIGDYAFKNNMLTKVEIPDKVTDIGEGAFSHQWKINLKDQSFEITYPDGIKDIKSNTFEAAGTPFKGKFPGVTSIDKDAFISMRDIEISAPKLDSIADGAFGYINNRDFTYPRVYTSVDTSLNNVDHQYLINPAVVTIKALNSRDHEDKLREIHYYGNNNTEINRTIPATKFYKIGETIKITPPDVMNDGINYTSNDSAKNIKLDKVNVVEFFYHAYEAMIRTPILASDTEIVGFGVPGGTINVEIGSNHYNGTANEDGFFVVEIDESTIGDAVSITVNGKTSCNTVVSEVPDSTYIAEDGVLKRYIGLQSEVTIPNTIDGAGKITAIGDFAFYDIPLYSVILPNAIESIGAGAFMNCGLTSFGWNLEDINKAGLISVNEYAFKNNDLDNVVLPELTHHVRTSAFENNSIKKLTLGKYTSHVAAKAFKDNFIESLKTAERQEEIGVSAFENNLISDLYVYGWMDGYDDGLTEIPDYAFRKNKLKEVKLPIEITDVSAEAFADNVSNNTRFIIESDNESVIPTTGYDVRRSDGTLLKYK